MSSRSGARERHRRRRWFLGDLAAGSGGPLRIRGRGSDSIENGPIGTTLFWDFPKWRWSRRSRNRGIRGIELRDLATTRTPEGDSRSSKEDPSISRVLESLCWLGFFLERKYKEIKALVVVATLKDRYFSKYSLLCCQVSARWDRCTKITLRQGKYLGKLRWNIWRKRDVTWHFRNLRKMYSCIPVQFEHENEFIEVFIRVRACKTLIQVR